MLLLVVPTNYQYPISNLLATCSHGPPCGHLPPSHLSGGPDGGMYRSLYVCSAPALRSTRVKKRLNPLLFLCPALVLPLCDLPCSCVCVCVCAAVGGGQYHTYLSEAASQSPTAGVHPPTRRCRALFARRSKGAQPRRRPNQSGVQESSVQARKEEQGCAAAQQLYARRAQEGSRESGV